MAKFKNVSPLGDLDIPAVGLVAAGEIFEVGDDLIEFIESQTENYERQWTPAERKARAAEEKAEEEAAAAAQKAEQAEQEARAAAEQAEQEAAAQAQLDAAPTTAEN